MVWVLLIHDPMTVVSELGFPAAIALLVFYALRNVTNKFVDFLMRQSEKQTDSLGDMHDALLIQSESLKEIRTSLSEMTEFWKGLNGKLRIDQ